MKWVPLADLLIHVHERSPGTSASPSWALAFRTSPSKLFISYMGCWSLAQMRHWSPDFFLKTFVFKESKLTVLVFIYLLPRNFECLNKDYKSQ